MGTSRSYDGPTRRNPLLPPWAPDADELLPGEPEDTPAPSPPLERPGSWRGVKLAMRDLAASPTRSTPESERVRRVGRRFTGALGGSAAAATSSRAARRTALRLGQFLAAVARDGVAAAAERFGIADYLGRGVAVFLAGAARVLAPAGATTEDAIAAEAYHETMAQLLEAYAADTAGIEALEALDEGGLRYALELYVANAVTARLLYTLAAQIETNAQTPARAVEVEQEVRDFVTAVVQLRFEGTELGDLAWDSPAATALVTALFADGYAMLEGALEPVGVRGA